MTHLLDKFKFCPVCGSDKLNVVSQTMKKCEACHYEMYKNPTIGAMALVFDEQNRLMVLRRSKAPALGTLDVPGGFTEPGETVEEAIIRELQEETNIKVEVEKYLFDIPNSYEYQGVDLVPLDFVFKCKIKDMSNIILDKSENSEILFLEKSQINIAEFGLASVRKALSRILASEI